MVNVLPTLMRIKHNRDTRLTIKRSLMVTKPLLTTNSTTTYSEVAVVHNRGHGLGGKCAIVPPRHTPAITHVLCQPCGTRVDIILLRDISTPMSQQYTLMQIYGLLGTLSVAW
jgi:hypothetical protein